MTIHWPIIRALLRHPTRQVIVDDSRTYRAIDVLVGSLHVAERLSQLSTTQTVGILLPTSGAMPIAALAAWSLGKTVVPLNYMLSKDELQYVVNDCGCDTIITANAMLDFLAENAPVGPDFLRLDDLDFHAIPPLRIPARPRPSSLGVLLYTSGTSGKPKGVMLSHANIAANLRQIRNWAAVSDRDVVLGVLPQFHSFGLTVLTILPLSMGMKAVYTARFVPAKILRLFREHRPTLFIGIPSMYNALFHAKSAEPKDFTSLRYTVSGGEPLPDAVFEGFRERFGITINEGYGLTETAPVSNWCRPQEWRRHSVGPALPEIDQRIFDLETGAELGQDREGEVRMRGPNIMQGYFNHPKETAAAFDAEGFFRTGDIGHLDADGHLYITGRLKEMLIVGGENVFPREIEEVLNAHPSVKDSGVIGVADPMRGEVPVAFVELKDGEAFDEKSILALCRDRLAGYKVPREITRLDALPRNPTGKVLRRELKKLVAGVKA